MECVMWLVFEEKFSDYVKWENILLLDSVVMWLSKLVVKSVFKS